MSAGPRLVVLCAGASTRLGRPKALVPLGRERRPALAHLLAAGAALGDARPLLVSGAEHERLLALLAEHVECVRNPDWRAGRTTSIQLAARLRPGADLCLAPIDVPRVPAEVFAALASAWSRHAAPARGWLAPFHGSGDTGSGDTGSGDARRFGHPVVIGRELLEALKGFPPERPLRDLRASAEPLLALEVASARILEDLDTPADLARFERDAD